MIENCTNNGVPFEFYEISNLEDIPSKTHDYLNYFIIIIFGYFILFFIIKINSHGGGHVI